MLKKPRDWSKEGVAGPLTLSMTKPPTGSTVGTTVLRRQYIGVGGPGCRKNRDGERLSEWPTFPSLAVRGRSKAKKKKKKTLTVKRQISFQKGRAKKWEPRGKHRIELAGR